MPPLGHAKRQQQRFIPLLTLKHFLFTAANIEGEARKPSSRTAERQRGQTDAHQREPQAGEGPRRCE